MNGGKARARQGLRLWHATTSTAIRMCHSDSYFLRRLLMASMVARWLVCAGVVVGMPVVVQSAGVGAEGADSGLRIVSRDSGGRQLGFAYARDISGDGGAVLLAAGGGMLLKDLDTGALRRVDLRDDGSAPVLGGQDASMSDGADAVVFVSYGTLFTSHADTNDESDVFLRRVGIGRTRLISVALDGSAGTGKSMLPAISANGRYVSFRSKARDLVRTDVNRRADIFLRDLRSGTTRRVSVGDDEQPADGGSWESAVSNDGRFVAFTSEATNLVNGDTNDRQDVFVRDMVERTTTRVSVASDGTQPNSWSEHVDISADGRHVTFVSRATNLATGDTSSDHDVFVHDLASGNTAWISRLAGSSEEGTSLAPSISRHGRFVAFNSTQNTGPPGVCSAAHNVYRWDRTTQAATCLSRTFDGSIGSDENSYGASISAHGDSIVFTSSVPTLVPHDANANEEDAYLWTSTD